MRKKEEKKMPLFQLLNLHFAHQLLSNKFYPLFGAKWLEKRGLREAVRLTEDAETLTRAAWNCREGLVIMRGPVRIWIDFWRFAQMNILMSAALKVQQALLEKDSWWLSLPPRSLNTESLGLYVGPATSILQVSAHVGSLYMNWLQSMRLE